jgi:hypothetical protein
MFLDGYNISVKYVLIVFRAPPYNTLPATLHTRYLESVNEQITEAEVNCPRSVNETLMINIAFNSSMQKILSLKLASISIGMVRVQWYHSAKDLAEVIKSFPF